MTVFLFCAGVRYATDFRGYHCKGDRFRGAKIFLYGRILCDEMVIIRI